MKILLGVTGSISCYKAYDIARNLVKSGHEVKVVLTKGAQKFLKHETFLYLGCQKAYLCTDDFKYSTPDAPVLHVDLAKWADKLVIAPASANTLGKISNGLVDDLLSSIFLAFPTDKPIILYPAMNTQMWENPILQKNLKTLNNLKNIFIYPPESGLLACGDDGMGKLPSVEAIGSTIPLINPLLKRTKNVLITAGATQAPLDPVRYLTNPASGKTGLELTKTFLARGFQVTVIVGHEYPSEFNNFLALESFTLVKAPTTREMRDEVLKRFSSSDIYISTAAISDIEFDESLFKVKKDSLQTSLRISKAPDILAEVLKLKSQRQIVIGFAAESSSKEDIFLEKWNRKKTDLLVGNPVHRGTQNIPQQGFKVDSGKYTFISDGKSIVAEKELSKVQLAEEIYQWTKDRFNSFDQEMSSLN